MKRATAVLFLLSLLSFSPASSEAQVLVQPKCFQLEGPCRYVSGYGVKVTPVHQKGRKWFKLCPVARRSQRYIVTFECYGTKIVFMGTVEFHQTVNIKDRCNPKANDYWDCVRALALRDVRRIQRLKRKRSYTALAAKRRTRVRR